jgi:hypothetical protein
LGRDEAPPIRKGRDRTQVLADVLLAYKTNGHDTAVGVDDGRPEQRFKHENAFGMVPKGPVPRISKIAFDWSNHWWSGR